MQEDKEEATTLSRRSTIRSYVIAAGPLSFLSSIAGIFAAVSLNQEYSTVLEDSPTLTATLVIIILQSTFALIGTLIHVSCDCWMPGDGYLSICMFYLLIGVEIIDLISEIIIISLLSSVKSEYDAEFRIIGNDMMDKSLDHALNYEELAT